MRRWVSRYVVPTSDGRSALKLLEKKIRQFPPNRRNQRTKRDGGTFSETAIGNISRPSQSHPVPEGRHSSLKLICVITSITAVVVPASTVYLLHIQIAAAVHIVLKWQAGGTSRLQLLTVFIARAIDWPLGPSVLSLQKLHIQSRVASVDLSTIWCVAFKALLPLRTVYSCISQILTTNCYYSTRHPVSMVHVIKKRCFLSGGKCSSDILQEVTVTTVK
jgi:hypothetical protein